MAPPLEVSIDKETQQLLTPLKTHFGIDYFGYGYFDDQNTALVTSNPSLQKKVLELINQGRYMPLAMHHTPGIHPWEHEIHENILCEVKNEYGYNPGVNLLIQKGNAFEKFAFASSTHANVVKLISQNYQAFMHFIHWFRENGDPMIRNMKKTTIKSIPKEISYPLSNEQTSSFIADTPIKKYPVNGLQSGNNYLTLKEVECLRYVLKLNSIKEIANQMSISVKTVEFHIKNIMEKTGVYRRSQFFEQYKYLM